MPLSRARRAEPASEQAERVEIRALLTLLGTWTLDKAETTAAFARCAHAGSSIMRMRALSCPVRLAAVCVADDQGPCAAGAPVCPWHSL